MAAEKEARVVEMTSEGLTVKLNVDVSEALTGLKAVQREAKMATRAVAELGAFGELRDINWDRHENFILILAAKEEGMTYSDREFVIVYPADVADKINDLRKEGYKIFTVLQPLGVVDDFMAEHEGRRERLTSKRAVRD
ncbi:hypothetical protein [Shouchella rhizosphaerae]|uniref:Uncharacterized protein n=1 Tax=Shouchella rhizosphaerae TaxID=866786 RepID=A0ABZ2CT43_9BACI